MIELKCIYSKTENKTFTELHEELMEVYQSYPEYHEKGFIKMVELFATDDFYHCHYVAKEYLKQRKM